MKKDKIEIMQTMIAIERLKTRRTGYRFIFLNYMTHVFLISMP